MRGFYSEGRIEAPGLGEFNSGGSGLTIRGKLVSLAVKTRDFEDRSIALVDTPQGLKIDWESFAGWSEIAWDKFTSSKPATGHVFRVTLSEVDYYNFDFSDDSKWRSYRLLSPDGETSLYGYAPKDSDLDRRIRPDSESKNIPLTLSLKFPPEAKSDRQVEIERLVTEGWVEEEDSDDLRQGAGAEPGSAGLRHLRRDRRGAGDGQLFFPRLRNCRSRGKDDLRL
jgi:hypothetical protein